MSRELKFRAWNIEEKRWSNADDGYWGDGDCFTPVENVNINLGNKEFIFEQYTGLKDKNGKEIYEGDIVRCILGDKPVEFRDCRYWLGETLDDLFVANLRYDIEVIGNIHEPPKDFRPEHLKRMGLTIEKGGEE